MQSPAVLPGWNVSGQASGANGGTLAVCVDGAAPWTQPEIDRLVASGAFAPGASLGIDTGNTTFTYTSDIADTGPESPLGIVVLGNGTLVLTGSDNAYSGGTTILSGTLQVGSGSSLGSGPLTMYGGSLDLNGNLVPVEFWQGPMLPSPITAAEPVGRCKR